MKRFLSCLLSVTMAFGPGFPLAAFAGPDDFIGDAGIYVGTPSARPKPNVLFVIDNSNATLNVASGSPFDPTFTYPNAGYDSWTIYLGDNQGDFSKVQVANSTNALENLTSDSCADIIRTTIVDTGTYSGSGTAEYPNLKAADCDTGPKGAIYALGNYLNYLNYVEVDDGDQDDDGVLDGEDMCPGYDDTLDDDNDGIPDDCDICASGDDTVDTDTDGVPDACDICAGYDDAIDTDGDTIPDGCDTLIDSDGDTVPDSIDQCIGEDDRLDFDTDGVPDGCDICPGFDDKVDTDTDTIPDGCDLCLGDNSLGDADGDGICGFGDSDGDGVANGDDICPGFDDGIDSDGDGVPDGCDQCDGDDALGDTDNDDRCDNGTWPSATDLCDGDQQIDADNDQLCRGNDLCFGDNSLGDPDGDGVCGDDSPADNDGDGVKNGDDLCEGYDDNLDSDGDGIPDGCDSCTGTDSTGDSDGDGVCNDQDICDGDDSTGDSDGDGICNNKDTCSGGNTSGDSDSDGICDDADLCFGDNSTGDPDNDGVCTDNDSCFGVDSTGDPDNDGICTDQDNCYGVNSTGDADNDGICNDNDICTGTDSSGDSDNDGVCNNEDPCPSDNPDDPDNNGTCGDQTPTCSPPYSYVIVWDAKGDDRYELTRTHTSTSTIQAGKNGGNGYWAILGSNDQRTANFGTWSKDTTYTLASDYCSSMVSPADQSIIATMASVFTRTMPVVSAGFAGALGVMSLFEKTAEAATAPVGVSGATQREIIYDALSLVVAGSRTAVNFGAITYAGNNHGAEKLYDISDLTDDTKFNEFKAALPGPGENDGAAVLSSNSVRPLSSALYDAGYYYGADYTAVTMGSQIPDAIKNECGYDHIIVITNGLPNNDASNPMPATIGDADGDGVDEDVYGLGDHYLDDVAYYLRENNGITTHTILAFQPSDLLVERAAMNGGGEFYNAYDAQELADALTKLMISIVNESDTAFVAPVVPASATNRTISSDRVYLGLFKPQIKDPWLGNIKKYRVGTTETLLDSQGNAATEVGTGNFIETSQSYWGTGTNADGDDIIHCFDGERALAAGDGGLVGCGGVGGALKGRDLVNDPRKIYTYPPSSGSTALTHANNAFVDTNALLTTSVLDVADAAEKNATINYIRGHDVDSIDPTAKRSWLLGDVLHSKPVVFNYTAYGTAQENLCSEDVTAGDPYNSSIIFVGANDGMLHAFRDCDGKELWGFIPPTVLKHLKEYRDGLHHYYVDSSPVAYVHDVDNDGNIETGDGDKIVLMFGLRRGGANDDINNDDPWGGYYLVDVSTPDAPVLLGSIDKSVTGLEKMGQTWAQPRLTKINDAGTTKVVAILTGGYDKNEDLRYGQTQTFPDTTDDDVANGSAVVPVQLDDGALSGGDGKTSLGTSSQLKLRGNAIYMIEVAQLNLSGGIYTPSFSNSGSVVWAYDDGDNNNLTYSIPSDILLLSGEGNYGKKFYVGDTGGRMWRFDISSATIADWEGEIIFNANDPDGGRGSDVGRKFFYRPAAAVIGGKVNLWFGSGDRVHPLNHAVIDRMYHLVDEGQDTADGINESRLVDLTLDQPQAGDADTVTETLNKLYNNPAVSGEPGYPYHGWMIKMNWDYSTSADSSIVGEKMLATPIIFNNETYYTTYTPDVDPNANDPCVAGNLGTARLYHLGASTGEAVFNYDLTNDGGYGDLGENSRAKGEDGEVLLRADRVKTLGHGIPSGVVTLIDASGRVTLMDNAGGNVHTTNATDLKLISPVYWMQW